MQIKMLVNTFGSSNLSGNLEREYKKDEILDCNEEWQIKLGQAFMLSGFAIETKVAKPDEQKVTKKKVAKKKVDKK